MPFIPHNSPEALLPRSDSKNPATTCKGITSNGRSCRRSLAASPRASPSPSGSPNPRGNRGVLAVLSDVNDAHEGAAAFYCWQHIDQAASLKQANGRADLLPLEERTSIDTLADRLGVLDVEDGQTKKSRKKRHRGEPVKRETLPQQWQNVSGPLMSLPEDPFNSRPASARPTKPRHKRTQGDMHVSFFCCMNSNDTDHSPAARPRPSMSQAPLAQPRPSTSRPPAHLSSRPLPTSQGYDQRFSPVQHQSRPSASTTPSHQVSQTQNLLSLIPTTLPPATTSLLLSELAKPLTPADREPGYIYIFCLSPNHSVNGPTSRGLYPDLSSPNPQPSNGNSLPVLQRALTGRRTSDAIRSFATSSGDGTRGPTLAPAPRNPSVKTLMLKIGRAQNVSRRMTQWSQQCGHPIDLLRYYPYHSPSNPPYPLPASQRSRRSSGQQVVGLMAAGGPRQVPLVPRVERLIHVELAEKKVKRSCEGCGREHREWFEIEATREGVRGVDEVVRRWVAWGEREGVEL
ncbi:MAG: hypothetical protein MMC23_000257 [Stictis urceolatum]|nr:hypothetical protein [Stictis urceolata]